MPMTTTADGVRAAPALLAGVAVLAFAWLGPLPRASAHSFAAHMTLHVSVIAIAAPLLAWGIARSRHDPVARWPAPFAPLPAMALELIVVWAWHAPALHHLAREHVWLFVVEQASFFATGLLVWLSALGDRARGERRAAGVAALLFASMHMTLLGVLLALSDRTLYAHHAHAPSGWTAQQDQWIGGVVMLAVGGSAYLLGGLALLYDLLRRPSPSATLSGVDP